MGLVNPVNHRPAAPGASRAPWTTGRPLAVEHSQVPDERLEPGAVPRWPGRRSGRAGCRRRARPRRRRPTRRPRRAGPAVRGWRRRCRRPAPAPGRRARGSRGRRRARGIPYAVRSGFLHHASRRAARSTSRGGRRRTRMPVACAGQPIPSGGEDVRGRAHREAHPRAPCSARSVAISVPVLPLPTTSTSRPANGPPLR